MISTQDGAVVAKEDILKDSIICKELPYISEQSVTSQNITACSNCGLSLVKPEDVFSQRHLALPDLKKAIKKFWLERKIVQCQTCDRVIYCGESCRQEAWDRYHKFICPLSPSCPSAMMYDVKQSFRDVMVADGSSWQGWWNAEFSPILMAKVFILSQVKEEDKDGWFRAMSHFERNNNNTAEPASHKVPKMFELMVSIFKKSKDLQFELTEESFNQFYYDIKYSAKCFHDVTDPLSQFVNKMKDDPKQYKKIGKYFREPLPKAEFHGLFLLIACLKHSCFPNAEIQSGQVNGKPGIVLSATKNISESDEILISYVDESLHRKERRDILFRLYNFWCNCIKCKFEGDGPEACTHCGKKANMETESNQVRENQARHMAERNSYPKEVNENACPETTAVTATASYNSESDSIKSYDKMPAKNLEIQTQNNDTPNRLSDTNSIAHVFKTQIQAETEFDHCSKASFLPTSRLDYNQSSSESTKISEFPEQPKNSARLPKRAETESSDSKSALQCDPVQHFPHCSKCKKAWYCSQGCQKEAWKRGHKKICVKK